MLYILPMCYSCLWCISGMIYKDGWTCTVKPMNRMCLTSLQKCNRARWQMLFHPTEFKLEFCNPLTFGQMWISCASWASTGWNMTQRNLLFIHDSWAIPSPFTAILHPDWPRNTSPSPRPTAACLTLLPLIRHTEIIHNNMHICATEYKTSYTD